VGVDPHGSILAQPDSLNERLGSYKVEGIGYDFIPAVLDRSLIDAWHKTDDKESFMFARRLIREEGLLCGGSSGSAIAAAVKEAKLLKEGQTLVVLLPDSVRNYMSKFLSDQWMLDNGFFDDENTSRNQDLPWSKKTVADLHLRIPYTISPQVPCSQAAEILEKQGFDQLPVVDEKGEIIGVVTPGNLMSKIVSGRVKSTDPVSKVTYSQFKKVTLQTELGTLSQIFNNDHFALVIATQTWYSTQNKESVKNLVVGVATRIDLLNFILSNKTQES